MKSKIVVSVVAVCVAFCLHSYFSRCSSCQQSLEMIKQCLFLLEGRLIHDIVKGKDGTILGNYYSKREDFASSRRREVRDPVVESCPRIA